MCIDFSTLFWKRFCENANRSLIEITLTLTLSHGYMGEGTRTRESQLLELICF